MMKTSSTCTTDSGAFWELVRAGRSVVAVIHIFPLDSVRCLRTGDPQVPVITPTVTGVSITKWYQVRALSDMPSSQRFYGSSTVP